jgi:two-component system chemotaxis sensor kinase CheA
MSKQQFEELVDDLSALLLTLDFGTTASLKSAQERLQAIRDFIAGRGLQALEASAASAHAELGEAQKKKGEAAKKAAAGCAASLEAFTQRCYDAAKKWVSAPSPETSSPKTLHLPEVADRELLADFIANTRLVTEELESILPRVRAGDADALAEVKRRVHTLKGEAGMLGLNAMSSVLHAAETYVESSSPSWDRADRLTLVRDWMADALESYAAGHEPGADIGPILNLLAIRSAPPPVAFGADHAAESNAAAEAEAAEETPATMPWDEEELDLVVEFIHESGENLATVDQTLLDIEKDGPSADSVNKLFRAFHTLKGVASFLRLEQVTRVAHTSETMLDMVRSGKLTAGTSVLDLVFDSTSMLRLLVEQVEVAMNQRRGLAKLADVPSLVARLEAATRGELPPPSALPPTNAKRVGEILVETGVVSTEELESALESQKFSGKRLGEQLIAEHVVAPKVVAQAIRAQAENAAGVAKTRELVKVDLERVDQLVETIGELVIVDSMVSNAPEIQQLPGHLRNYLAQFSKITRELQELGMRMRMVPMRAEFQKMARMVRELTRRSDKQVRMEIRGESTEMDRSMVERIADPLVHLIRNAVDHGVESPNERVARGKPEIATIVLSAMHEGGSIVIEISDDGKGIDRERVIAKAVAQGLVSEGANLSETQVYDLLFMPGFSTAAQVTDVSGRGVGMDVVKRNVEALHGRIITYSTPGKGTTFRLVLPLTLAIIDGMVVRCGAERFILPTLSILESLKPTQDMLFSIGAMREQILVRGRTLPLLRMDRLLDIPDGHQDPTKGLVVIAESLRNRVALLVDEVVMKHQVVIKTLSTDLAVSHLFAGAAILSSGRVGLIINVESLVAQALAERAATISAVA